MYDAENNRKYWWVIEVCNGDILFYYSRGLLWKLIFMNILASFLKMYSSIKYWCITTKQTINNSSEFSINLNKLYLQRNTH